MSLIACRECGKDVSTMAKACPHCGAPPPTELDRKLDAIGTSDAARKAAKEFPQPAKGDESVAGFIGTTFVLLVAVWFLVRCTTDAPSDSGVPEPPAATGPDPVGAAYQVCAAAKATQMTTACDVEGWGKRVDMRIDTTGSEARKMCASIAAQVAGGDFAGQGWTLRILTPYSGDQPVAVCDLR